MNIPLRAPLGFVELDGAWVDDRRRCTWALCDLSLVVEPGQTVALVADGDEGGPDAVLDLLAGRRRPSRGRVGIDGIDLRDLDPVTHLRALTAEYQLDRGERRLTVAGRSTLVAHPTPASLHAADEVLVFRGGFAVARGTHRSLLATSNGYGRVVASPREGVPAA
ncbi:MAG TPA: hypothetical protein VF230_00475 [Acidimicrobiales bacterium]